MDLRRFTYLAHSLTLKESRVLLSSLALSPAQGPIHPFSSQPLPPCEKRASGPGARKAPPRSTAFRISKDGAGQGVGPALVMGPSTNQEAPPSPASPDQPFLSPGPRCRRLALDLRGTRGQAAPSGGPRWGKDQHRHLGSLGEPGRRVSRDPSLGAWHWAKCLCALSHLVFNSPRR